MVSKGHRLSVRRQCSLLTLARSNLYYEPKGESAENLRFMELIHCPAGACAACCREG
jgi:putative transposase